MNVLPSASVLVRTWFGDDAAWESLTRKVEIPSAEGFLASITLVNDPIFEALSTDALIAQQSGGSIVSFLADEITLTHAEHPIVAVRMLPRPDSEPFRVVPAALWSVENNINLANMDWTDFTTSLDADGVFRGF
ncbi:DUF6924 domain-containing protein [Nocardia sp. N2S4-5]|uniref:DUF6924 domain-containing protein n=1 Tax=Nocardia sp. N2S4-5 TaxID=3351565 RepID=UPI0037D541FA